ncbi:MAG: hypothetical protein AAGA20_04435, partial [Planctomycetota bacterium]
LAVPAAHPYTAGDEALRRMEGEDVLTQGLLFPIGRGALELFERATPESTMRLIAGLTFGLALMMTLAFLRGLGFRRSTCVPAALAAFAVPYAWIGGTSPIDYAPGMFGASLLLWSLLRQEQGSSRGYQWRAILAFGLAYMLHLETVLLIPAVALAVSRHPEYRREAQVNFYAVVVVLVMSITIGLTGASEAERIGHLAERSLAGADSFGPRALGQWIVALPIGLGVILFGLYQMLFAARAIEAKRAPVWIVPWSLAFLAPVVAGSPEFEPISPYLIPAGALGLADWLNRRGTAAKEARFGALLVGAQVAATVAIVLWVR